MTENARQHFKMKYQLAAMALQKPQRFLASTASRAHYLAMLWDGIGQELPAEARVTSTGLAATTLEADGCVAVGDHVPVPPLLEATRTFSACSRSSSNTASSSSSSRSIRRQHDTVLVEIKPDVQRPTGRWASPRSGLVRRRGRLTRPRCFAAALELHRTCASPSKARCAPLGCNAAFLLLNGHDDHAVLFEPQVVRLHPVIDGHVDQRDERRPYSA